MNLSIGCRKTSKTIEWQDGALRRRAECRTIGGKIAYARLVGDPTAEWVGEKRRSQWRRLAIVLGGLLPLMRMGAGDGVLNAQTVAAGIPAAPPTSDLFVGSPSPSPAPSPTPSPSPASSRTPPLSPPPLGRPIRAAFVYPWYPETWSQGSHFMPYAAHYDSGDTALMRMQIASMLYANVTTGITSWFGPGTREDSRIPAQLAADHGTTFSTALYYEQEGYKDPSPVQIAADMDYAARYFADQSYLRIRGRPVVFVYANGADGCGMADRWARGTAGKGLYIVLKVFPGYLSCANQPPSWHQYSGASREDKQGRYSTTISPGFWKVGERAPRLPRDPVAFAAAVRDMVSRPAQWQLIVSFNELVEGTQIEATTQSFTPCSGWSVELNILHRNGQPGPC